MIQDLIVYRLPPRIFVSGWLTVTPGYQNFGLRWLPVTTGYHDFSLRVVPVTPSYQNFRIILVTGYHWLP